MSTDNNARDRHTSNDSEGYAKDGRKLSQEVKRQRGADTGHVDASKTSRQDPRLDKRPNPQR